MTSLDLMACFLPQSHVAVARESVTDGGELHDPGDVALGSPTAGDHLPRPRHLQVATSRSWEMTDLPTLRIAT
jgi:hypothetical protein